MALILRVIVMGALWIIGTGAIFTYWGRVWGYTFAFIMFLILITWYMNRKQ